MLEAFFVQQIAPAQTIIQDTISFGNAISEQPENGLEEIVPDSVSILPSDSTAVAANDSIRSNAIDAPIQYTADTIIMKMDGRNLLYLLGKGNVTYKSQNLTGEYIEVEADSSIVYATYGIDSIGNEFGYPVFKDGETQYEMKKVRYNFKTEKMYITDVITKQGESYVTATKTKKMPNDDLFMRDGRLTTCDEPEPHYYFHMTKVKVKPGKSIAFGPAYLVIEDVPLPVALPFGYFPFTHDYSSGIIMPTYGDEMTRGFSLREGGYYFAFNDYVDLAVTGEIYTKGSWGLNTRSTYRKRYKFSGNFNAGYLVTILGDKGANDYSKTKDFKVNWSHSQDAKANPFSTLSASVNFSTSSYDRNELSSIYSNQYSQNTKASSINYSYRPPNSPFSFSANASINQVSRDTSISITFPNLTVNMRDIYPFKRKEQVGSPRWYENIKIRYTGLLMNSVTSKEYNLFEKNIIKDWRNGIKHDIPVSASFNLMKYITISPSVNYTETWYSSRVEKWYDYTKRNVVTGDTIYGFNRTYNYNANVSLLTKLYGMYKPWGIWGIFGKKVSKAQIRHVLTPSVNFSGSPDFSDKKYGFYKDLIYYDKNGQLDTLTYSPYESHLWGAPGRGRTGSVNFSLDNNLEIKVPVGEADSTKKISLIDNLRLGMSYNFLADSMNWSDLSVNLRLKFTQSLNFNIQAQFDTYTYNEQGTRINVPRWKAGKGIGRLRSTGWSFSYSINNSMIKNLFKKGETDNDAIDSNLPPEAESSDLENMEDNSVEQTHTSLRKSKVQDVNRDENGYLLTDIAWNLSFNYSLSVGYDMAREKFNTVTREYPYRFNQTLDFSGNINPTKAWGLTFSASYDFDYKKFSNFFMTVTRQMHCWSMSASIRPIGPYQSYNFSIAVNSSILKDLKYTQSSNSRDAMNWGE